MRPPGIRATRIVVILAGLAVAPPIAAAAQLTTDAPDTVILLDSVHVRVSPLGTNGVPLRRLPNGAQVVESTAISGSGQLTIADALKGLVGVTAASQFGSELQPDIRFRGFQVGPVVGYPQSVSVFVDGVRVNEPDASQVNFDLIPLHALERIEVIRAPGGAFGRNTLAGAINVVTRRGEGAPAGGLELSGGSFRTGEAAGWFGASAESGLDVLVSGRLYRSDGWRDLNESRLNQLFAKIGMRSSRSDLWLSYTFADHYVEGPGSLPVSWLRGELPSSLADTKDPRRLQFTGFEGDNFVPRMHFVVASGSRRLSERSILRANTFFRANDFTQFNDNITEANARGETSIASAGGTAQLERVTDSGATLTGGVELVRNDVGIRIFEVANAAFPTAGGLTEHVETVEWNLGAFTSLWWPVNDDFGVTASLRYDYVDLPFVDILDPENSGENQYHQLGGSMGADLRIRGPLRAFASYGRGFRAPVILELSCADPLDPCPLPFELGADPPLDPVTTDLFQGGLRYSSAPMSAELVAYWAEVHDDLFNVILPPGTRGYFKNLDRTRRQGIELSALAMPLGGIELHGKVGLTRATFQTEAILASALVDDDDDEEEGGGLEPAIGEEEELDEDLVRVQPGDRMAMVPGITAQGGARFRRGGWSLELNGSYVGSQFFVGDEDNEERFGKLDSYFVLDARAARQLASFEVYVAGQNLLDAEFNTFGLISPNVRGPETGPQPFLTPGLPLRATVGVRWQF